MSGGTCHKCQAARGTLMVPAPEPGGRPVPICGKCYLALARARHEDYGAWIERCRAGKAGEPGKDGWIQSPVIGGEMYAWRKAAGRDEEVVQVC